MRDPIDVRLERFVIWYCRGLLMAYAAIVLLMLTSGCALLGEGRYSGTSPERELGRKWKFCMQWESDKMLDTTLDEPDTPAVQVPPPDPGPAVEFYPKEEAPE